MIPAGVGGQVGIQKHGIGMLAALHDGAVVASGESEILRKGKDIHLSFPVIAQIAQGTVVASVIGHHKARYRRVGGGDHLREKFPQKRLAIPVQDNSDDGSTGCFHLLCVHSQMAGLRVIVFSSMAA